MPRRLDIPCPALRQRYDAGESTIALAAHYGCSPTTIANRLRTCGAALRDSRFQPVQVAPGELRRLYVDERLPIAVIAARLGIAPSTVGTKRRLYGIPPRPRGSRAR